ncbi:MAG: PucR family transcriptional regulator, partial [Mycobacteriales bacterium]
MVGGAVAIEDPQRRVIAYSSLSHQPIDETRRQGILGRKVPHDEGDDELYRQLQRAPGVMRVPGSGDVLPRLAVAIRAGTELLGSLWVVEGTPLGPDAEHALNDAGRLAALHVLRARASADVERRVRSELLRGLLDGRTSPEVAAVRLGLEVTARVAVLGFSLPEPQATEKLDTDAVADLVQLQCTALRRRSSVLVQLSTVYALLPLDEDISRSRLRQLAESVVERARVSLQVKLHGAVGST